MEMERVKRVKRIIEEIKERRILTPVESEEILEIYNISVVKQGLDKTLNEAVSMANKIGYSVVLKIASLNIVHKSDIGRVKTNITSQQNLQGTYGEIIERTRKHRPDAVIWGVLVQKWLKEA